MDRFFIPKLEGDYSDILLARGIAELVEVVLVSSGKSTNISISDLGQFYIVESGDEITEQDLSTVSFKVLYPLIYYEKMDVKPGYVSGKNLVDYTEEKKYKDWSAKERKSSLIRQATGVPLSNKIMDDIYEI